ncbi:MAG: proline iminopeptidase [Hyphomicrobiales bacterium]|nr:proline iminopeptidase [Hyphomicrobiales bacterium]
MTPAGFYPPIEPHASGHLEVGDGHSIYWEACGNPSGKPALFLHGGPGGGCSTDNRRLFDPALWRIILFDQRGAGRSRPLGHLAANTTRHLVADIEALRVLHGVERWDLVLGGSWGATLALVYAQSFRERVRALVLRGVFTARAREIDWLYGDGARHVFPEAHEAFLAHLPEDERADPILAYHRRLTSGHEETELAAAGAWCAYEGQMLTLLPRGYVGGSGFTSPHTRALARIEAHYFVNQSFLPEGEILGKASRLAGLPGVIVQGRYDAVTPPVTAFELHRAWPGSTLDIAPDAGHATVEPGMLRRIIAATDHFGRL